jgi:flagellar protein FlbT
MSLKLSLKPHEKVIIGGAVISAGNKHVELLIENVVPIMRQKDIMLEENANTPARRIYFAIQLMYIDAESRAAHVESFFELAREILVAAPSAGIYIQQICDAVTTGQFYHALKNANQLIAYEKELTANV